MAEGKPSPQRVEFQHVPNRRGSRVVESYCPNCGLFIGASTNPGLLAAAEHIHTCPESLKFAPRRNK
jgi:hypothetical protein